MGSRRLMLVGVFKVITTPVTRSYRRPLFSLRALYSRPASQADGLLGIARPGDAMRLLWRQESDLDMCATSCLTVYFVSFINSNSVIIWCVSHLLLVYFVGFFHKVSLLLSINASLFRMSEIFSASCKLCETNIYKTLLTAPVIDNRL